ncbi:hypothetical protein RDWZM_007363 [Blomia tropicalis]|uniref:Ribosome biogenesis regulatory protein n=1 Tax=Blomia tropicalis TaxID=40697 RepID=A0A9Q0RKD5_BLOTA|nr:hypothetical protein RDWZM_007363 [Blomia tropicalis]
MAPALVQTILEKAEENEQKALQSVSVQKAVDLTYDLRHLAAFDENPIDLDEFRKNKNDYIAALTRDNAQLVVNKLFTDMETKRVDNVVVALLPKTANYMLPREKSVPKAKPPTKWEQYAKDKGIQKRKKEKLVWDETAKEWKPRFGYHGINQKKDQWMIEVPDQKDPNVDYFAEESEKKKERIAKNELQRLRNIARATKMRLPGTSGLVPNAELNKNELEKAKELVKHSTASMGKFVERLRDEKEPRNLGKKRKFEPNTSSDLSEEKSKNLAVVNQILAARKVVNDTTEDDAIRSANKLKRKSRKDGDDDEDDSGDRRKSRGGSKRPRGGKGNLGSRQSPGTQDKKRKTFKKGPQIGNRTGGRGRGRK